MCGIDRADQNNRYYSSGRNWKPWPIRIAFHQLETSINNSYHIYRASSPLNRLTSREYQMTSATQLMSSFSRKVPTMHRQRAQPEVAPRLHNVGSHMLLIGPPEYVPSVPMFFQPSTKQHKGQMKDQQNDPDHHAQR